MGGVAKAAKRLVRSVTKRVKRVVRTVGSAVGSLLGIEEPPKPKPIPKPPPPPPPPKPPKVTPEPKVPTREDAQAALNEQERKRKAAIARRQGRSSTMKTGGLGVIEEASVVRSTLLGS